MYPGYMQQPAGTPIQSDQTLHPALITEFINGLGENSHSGKSGHTSRLPQVFAFILNKNNQAVL